MQQHMDFHIEKLVKNVFYMNLNPILEEQLAKIVDEMPKHADQLHRNHQQKSQNN